MPAIHQNFPYNILKPSQSELWDSVIGMRKTKLFSKRLSEAYYGLLAI